MASLADVLLASFGLAYLDCRPKVAFYLYYVRVHLFPLKEYLLGPRVVVAVLDRPVAALAARALRVKAVGLIWLLLLA